jgi:hypothetical protein
VNPKTTGAHTKANTATRSELRGIVCLFMVDIGGLSQPWRTLEDFDFPNLSPTPVELVRRAMYTNNNGPTFLGYCNEETV